MNIPSKRLAAEQKVDTWLKEVTDETFAAELARTIDELVEAEVLMLRDENEKRLIYEGSIKYYQEFSRRIIELSDARCVYFAPDPRSKTRGISNLRAWAEYAVHAVTNGGAAIPGKEYHVRWFNHRKVENLDRIEPTLLAEGCVPVLKNNPAADAIKFFGETHEGGVFDVVVRLDEYGNAEANMTEITFEVAKPKKVRCPRLRPLSEAVEAVVCHQAAGTNPSTN